jgi:hypothetical protein
MVANLNCHSKIDLMYMLGFLLPEDDMRRDNGAEIK